jgi:hypothetical protein
MVNLQKSQEEMQTMIGSIGSTESTTAVPMGVWTSRGTVGCQSKGKSISKIKLASQTKSLKFNNYLIWIKAVDTITRFYCCHLQCSIISQVYVFLIWYIWQGIPHLEEKIYIWKANSGTHIQNDKSSTTIWLRIRNIPANLWSPHRLAICQAPPWHFLPTKLTNRQKSYRPWNGTCTHYSPGQQSN